MSKVYRSRLAKLSPDRGVPECTVELTRWQLADAAVRVFAPIALDRDGVSHSLRELPEIVDAETAYAASCAVWGSWRNADDYITAARAIGAAHTAARSAAHGSTIITARAAARAAKHADCFDEAVALLTGATDEVPA